MSNDREAARKLLAQAIEEGATFADFLGLYAQKNGERDARLIEKARRQIAREGEIEIDDTTICSGTDDDAGGDYVLAWVWVKD